MQIWSIMALLVAMAFPCVAINANDDIETYDIIQVIQLETVSDIAWSPDGSQLAIVHNGSIEFLDSETWETLLMIPDARVSHVVWKSDGTQVASVSGGNPSSLYIWNAMTGDLIEHLEVDYGSIQGGVFPMYELSWSNDDSLIASDSYAVDVLIWDPVVHSVYVLGSHEMGRVMSVDWNATSDLLISSGSDGTLHIWDVETNQSVLTFPGFHIAEWHPTENWIMTLTDYETITVFDTETGKAVNSFNADARIIVASWNVDGSLLVMGGNDGSIQIWDTNSESIIQVINNLENPLAVAWHPTENILALADYIGRVHVWEISTLAG